MRKPDTRLGRIGLALAPGASIRAFPAFARTDVDPGYSGAFIGVHVDSRG
jgi:hypothetical protein